MITITITLFGLMFSYAYTLLLPNFVKFFGRKSTEGVSTSSKTFNKLYSAFPMLFAA